MPLVLRALDDNEDSNVNYRLHSLAALNMLGELANYSYQILDSIKDEIVSIDSRINQLSERGNVILTKYIPILESSTKQSREVSNIIIISFR
jgi:hypothetical protein